MSLHDDYVFTIVAKQRHTELLARAAEDRLARLVPRRAPWWRRLFAHLRCIGGFAPTPRSTRADTDPAVIAAACR